MKNHHILQDGGNSNMCGIFTPNFGEDDPIWRLHMFQMGWFNHQPVYGQSRWVPSVMASQPAPPNVPPQREGCNKAWLDKGNQWFS